MQIIKETLEIEKSLAKKINMTLKFLNIKATLKSGSIISIKDTNLAYIEPHTLEINGTTYLFFNECEEVFINTLDNSIPICQLENHIKKTEK